MDENKLNEIGHQFTLDEWSFIRDDIKRRLAESASNFVGIGFRLKQLKETEMFDGCKDIFEFAQKEYGMSKSGVYRFMAINTKYSEGGNSLLLREEFRNFSVSKLDEMLALPDSEIEMITEDTTISQIRELKEFDKEEKELTEEVNAAAGQTETVEHEETASAADDDVPFPTSGKPISQVGEYFKNQKDLYDCIKDFFKNRKEEFNATVEILKGKTEDLNHWNISDSDVAKVAELINPSGNLSHRFGKVFIFFYDSDTGIKYKMLGQGVNKITWAEFIEHFCKYIYEPEIWLSDNPHEVHYGKEEKEIPDVGKNATPIEEKSAKETSEIEEIEGETLRGTKNEVEKGNQGSEKSLKEENESHEETSKGIEETGKDPEHEREETIDINAEETNRRLSSLKELIGNADVREMSITDLERLEDMLDFSLIAVKEYKVIIRG